MTVGSAPTHDVPGIAVRKGALYELARHIRPFVVVRALADVDGVVDQLIGALQARTPKRSLRGIVSFLRFTPGSLD